MSTPNAHTLAQVASAPNLDWATEHLAIGGRFATEHVSLLAGELRVRRVVDLRAEDRDDVHLLQSWNIEWLHLPAPDLMPASHEQLDTGVAWVCEAVRRGERVLVHCEHGIGRSALLACCCLVALGDDPRDALLRAKNARERVSPSPRQLEAFLSWSARHAERTGRPRSETSWEDLARIAYRHLAK